MASEPEGKLSVTSEKKTSQDEEKDEREDELEAGEEAQVLKGKKLDSLTHQTCSALKIENIKIYFQMRPAAAGRTWLKKTGVVPGDRRTQLVHHAVQLLLLLLRDKSRTRKRSETS